MNSLLNTPIDDDFMKELDEMFAQSADVSKNPLYGNERDNYWVGKETSKLMNAEVNLTPWKIN